MLVQRFELQGRRFTNFHYYYYFSPSSQGPDYGHGIAAFLDMSNLRFIYFSACNALPDFFDFFFFFDFFIIIFFFFFFKWA